MSFFWRPNCAERLRVMETDRNYWRGRTVKAEESVHLAQTALDLAVERLRQLTPTRDHHGRFAPKPRHRTES
jgi:hypothetical protein